MMTRFIKRSLITVIAALIAISATAAGKVEVIGDSTHGTVTSKADGAVITITITPASGYYIRKSDILALKTYMPVAEARGQSIPIADKLTLVGNDPDDLSQTRSYTITLPGEEYDVLLDVNYWSRQTVTEQMVSLSETVFVYNEHEQRPTVIVRGQIEGRDYKVDFDQSSSIEAGVYTLTVTGLSTWRGSVSRSYQIIRGGKAEVNNSLTGGIIATMVDGMTVTLTVTPDDGYYIRKEDIAVYKTYMPVSSEARGSIPITDQLTLVGDDPDDLSLPRTYTTKLPGWEYSAYVNAVFTERSLVADNMVTLSPATFIYNGEDQKPQVTVSGLILGVDYLLDFDGTSWSDVGAYSLTVTGRSTWRGTVVKDFTITKAPSIVTLVPEPKTLIYTGAEQQLLSAGDAQGGVLLYSTSGTDFKTAIPKATSAGKYTVYYKVLGDANHLDTSIATQDVTIGKKDVTVSGITAEGKVYDGNTQVTLDFTTASFDGLVEGDALTVSANGAFEDASAGTDKKVFITNLTLGGTSIVNYQLAASGQQTEAKAAIGKKDVTVIAHDKTMFHGMSIPELTFEFQGFVNDESEDILTVMPTIFTTAVKGSLPGKYDIVVSGGEALNYSLYYVNGVLTIKVSDLILNEVEENASTLTEHSGWLCNVTLKRTLQTGGYNTLSLPFAITLEQLKDVLGEDVKVKQLAKTELNDEKLVISFEDATGIEAGHPYMVKVSGMVEDPVFNNVSVSATVKMTETSLVDFVPTLGKAVLVGEDAKSIFFVGASNTLYNPSELPADIKGFRAYFQLKSIPGQMVRSCNLFFDDEETTAIHAQKWKKDRQSVYNMKGQRVDALGKGLYVIGGKKVVVK